MKYGLILDAVVVLLVVACLTACGRIEEIPQGLTHDTAGAEIIRTPGHAPDIFIICWKGLTFASTGSRGGLIQVFDSTGKLMECKS